MSRWMIRWIGVSFLAGLTLSACAKNDHTLHTRVINEEVSPSPTGGSADVSADLGERYDNDDGIVGAVDMGLGEEDLAGLDAATHMMLDQGDVEPEDMFSHSEADMDMPAQGWGLEEFPWFFSIHSFEVDADMAIAEQAFQEVIALGGDGIRTDIMWYEIEPEQGVTNTDYFTFYQEYFRRAAELGLKPLVIFSNPPEWAIDLYIDGERELFWTLLESYVRLSTLMVRDHTNYYQLWNEPNHIIDPIAEEDDGELIERIGRVVRELDPDAVLMVNAMTNVPQWEDSVTRWVQRAGDYIDIIGVDHYPGTWAGFDFTDWAPVEILSRRINDSSDPWYGKYGAVMETGFSSWAPLVADETRQATWINESLAVLKRIIYEQNLTQRYTILFGNYYQLIDVDTNGVGQEAHFGILRSDFSHKEGYTSLRQILSQFD